MSEQNLLLNKELLELNFRDNEAKINVFLNELKNQFEDLDSKTDSSFTFDHVFSSPNGITEYEKVQFNAYNASQHPVFMRRFDFSISDKPGIFKMYLYRAKRNNKKEDWKFHDKQNFEVTAEKLTNDVIKELLDWFIWKDYFPRIIRS